MQNKLVRLMIHAALAVTAALGLGRFDSVAAQDMGAFTLQPGVELKTAFTSGFGPDAEALTSIAGAGPTGYSVSYASTRGLVSKRNILAADRQNSGLYVIGFGRGMPVTIPGSTTLGLSSATFEQLRNTGQAPLALAYDTKLSSIAGVLTVVNRDTRVPIIVVGRAVDVPALHARGVFRTGSRQGFAEFFFLNNRNNPMMLMSNIQFSWENRPRTAKIVRIAAGQSQQKAMEQTLATRRRLEVYGIHFDFNKASIRPEARSLIADIAKTLELNPTWTLSIEGHTDSIGGASVNQRLSEARARSVMNTLVQRHGINAARLTSRGWGLTKPKATNKTLQGRALNRRVELVRTDR